MNICYLNRTTRQVLKQIWFASQNEFGFTLYNDITQYLANKLNLTKRSIERSIAFLLQNNLIIEAKKDGRIRRFTTTEFATDNKSKWDIGKEGIIKRKCYLRLPSSDINPNFFVAENVAENVAESKAIYINTENGTKSSSISPSTTKIKKREKEEEDFFSEHERLKQKYGDEAWDRAMNYIAAGNQVFNLERLLKSNKRNLDIVKSLPKQISQGTYTSKAKKEFLNDPIYKPKLDPNQLHNLAKNEEQIVPILNAYDLNFEHVSDFVLRVNGREILLVQDPRYTKQTLDDAMADNNAKKRSKPIGTDPWMPVHNALKNYEISW